MTYVTEILALFKMIIFVKKREDIYKDIFLFHIFQRPVFVRRMETHTTKHSTAKCSTFKARVATN